jgi:hypothetical protein
VAAGFRSPLWLLGTGSVSVSQRGFHSLLAFWAGGGQAGTSGLGGRLIARHRSRTPWWDEDEALAQLLWAMGIAPPERDTKTLRAAAKQGLTALVQSEPYAIRYAEGALLLETTGQVLRLHGALRRHVETLADDQEFMDLLDIIA